MDEVNNRRQVRFHSWERFKLGFCIHREEVVVDRNVALQQ